MRHRKKKTRSVEAIKVNLLPVDVPKDRDYELTCAEISDLVAQIVLLGRRREHGEKTEDGSTLLESDQNHL